ncbi:hypothetical protein AVEN_271312-1 [Araneus ventricosus]|uniref:Uncharacterized protein n=1 Tax=Araneus ventricosus TaxID=182803 RepID=A0A4Y2P819_ARAVE|nr:hypothetical protein AVEN_271312-1 [Araneus ventricosus]
MVKYRSQSRWAPGSKPDSTEDPSSSGPAAGFEECDQENIQDWLECDVDNPCYQVLAGDKIIAIVIDDQDLRQRERD